MHLAEANLRIATLTEKLTASEKEQGMYVHSPRKTSRNATILIPMTEASAHAQSKEAQSSHLVQQSLQEENSQLLGQVKQLVSGDELLCCLC